MYITLDILKEVCSGLSDAASGCIQIFRVELNGCQIDHRLERTFIHAIRVEDRSSHLSCRTGITEMTRHSTKANECVQLLTDWRRES